METNRYNVSTAVNELSELSEIAELSAVTLLPADREKFDSCTRSLLKFGFDANQIFPDIRNEFHFAWFDSLISSF
ncbi:unnamed protein product, partial [Staurois parvus]